MNHVAIYPALDSLLHEEQIIGAILSKNELYHQISAQVRYEHFSHPVLADIWRNASARIEKGHLASPVTVKNDLADNEGFAQMGGAEYLLKLVAGSVSSFAIKDYAADLQAMDARREMSGRLEQMADELRSDRSADEVASELELMLAEREQLSSKPRAMSLLKAHTLAAQEMHEIKEGKSPGAPSGLQELDEEISFAPGRYTIIGGATSMGKSALALTIAYSAARAGHGVGFVTLEMPETDLAKRIASIDAGLAYSEYDRPMSEQSFNHVVAAMKGQQSLPIQIFSGDVRDVSAVLSEGKKLKRQWVPNARFQGFKVLIIDYIQLMRGKGQNSFEQLSRVANDLKQIAKQLEVHVITLAQVDRKMGLLDSWQDWEKARPSLAHLRGSGDLENAPDNVLFVFRPEYYLTPPRCTKPKPTEVDELADYEAEYYAWKGKAEIIIAKARMGEIGSIKVGCDMATNRFWDLDPVEEQGMF